MNSHLPTVACVAALVLGTAAFVQDPTPKANELLSPVVSFRGEHSAIDETRYVKITDEQAWAGLWCEHIAKTEKGDYGYFYNPKNVPIVDFKQCMVIAIFQGERWNTAGVTCEEVLDGKQLTLRFDGLGYQTTVIDPDDAEAQEKSRPFGMFVLPKSDKVILLEENVQNRMNQPPKWRARGKL